MKQATKECDYCKEKDRKDKSYEEEIEKEKVTECLKALERETIAKGMQCKRVDEIQLKALQKAQVEEKRYIEMEEENRERMWHQILLDDVRRKEKYEEDQENRRQQEMIERRLAYDRQIASANRKRRETLQQEREKENRRLERMRKKMEQDHFEALKRKKEQQITNKINFIEGHETKLRRLESEKLRERQMDNNAIRTALNETDREIQRKSNEMRRLQMEKKYYIEGYNLERRMTRVLDEDRDNAVDQIMKEKENRTEEWLWSVEEKKRMQKVKMAEEYRTHIAEQNLNIERERQERDNRMQEVKRVAVLELHKKLDSANEELKKQLEYRNNLSTQIKNNQRALATEMMNEEIIQRPFTKRANMFRDAMIFLDKDPGRASTNPVHPFKRVLDAKKVDCQLPSICGT